MIRNPKVVRAVALYLLIQFTTSIIYPSVSFALTSGPSQPEFSSFEPVATTNMVDEFFGDFTYNLPLLEVPGPQGSSYPISLSYHSGASPEEEASWVGYGWTLNPGAINRGTRGLPDDYKDQDIVFHNKMPKNWTGTVGGGVGFGEIFGVELKEIGVDLSATVSLRYNNYRGFGYNAGVGVSLGRGLVSMGYNVSDGSGSYSLNVNPSAVLTWNSLQNHTAININRDRNRVLYDKGIKRDLSKKIGSGINLKGSSYGILSYTEVSKPNIVNQYKGNSFNVTVSLEGNPIIVPVGGSGFVFGSYTYQENISSTTVKGNGFMYTADANSDYLTDYHVEQEKDYNKRDVFLGIPFNDADNFIVTGEGIGGGFRLHNKTAGQFGPRGAKSETNIYNVGGEIGVGWTFGPSADIGKGSHVLNVDNWDKNLSTFTKYGDNAVDEPLFFRFNNDMGGEWGTNHDDLPFRANVYDGNKVSLPAGRDKYNIGDDRNGRSSYIGYHTNKEIVDAINNQVPGYSGIYSRNSYVNALSKRHQADGNLIGEIAVFNETGGRYVYALPVYAKGEKNLSFSARGLQEVKENFIGYTSSPNESVKVGEEKMSPYATTYLLTEITTPDYIDRGSAGEYGPSSDDLGGYTRFNYIRTSDAFRWRAPYRGMLYNKNSHSDPLDDLVSYSEGDKEIYYLQSIETKTHVAMFETTDRKDGRAAAENAFANAEGYGAGSLKKLDKIKLYSITDCVTEGGKLKRDPVTGSPIVKTDAIAIKTVYFDYDYSLCSSLPNSIDKKGKLTLKRVYTEYNGINRLRISPYEFNYSYPTTSEYSSFPAKYKSGGDNDVVSAYSNLSEENQNPPYSLFLADAWGNYQAKGDTRFRNMEPWLSQEASSIADFDPAVWQLKVIKLPSGGEIHVQYEQDDYSFVQDQRAHVMAKLADKPVEIANANLYTIDPASIGITGASDIAELRSMIIDRYVTQGKKIYFKFFYRLVGNREFTGTDEDLKWCNAEFITGYISVRDCVPYGDGKLALILKDEGRLPVDVCRDFVKAQRLGKVFPDQDCDPANGIGDPSDAKALVSQLLRLSNGILIPGQLCQSLDPKHSYFRIPTPLAKKGGGIRVKRLMMFDKGLEGQPVLYGNEYIYQAELNGKLISSGVATNEPQSIREENILVDFVARKKQNVWNRIIAGKDKEQSEGPIGESMLPGASVGYSRVIVRNIHSGKTTPGFSVSEFYTARDYPIRLGQPDDERTMTTIKRTDDNPLPISAPFYTKIKNKTSAAQGFSFVINSMHGQPRRNASYGGAYVADKKLSEYTEVNSATYEYFEPGEKIPVMSSLYGGVTKMNPGREVDITFSQRKVTEVSNDVNVEADLQLTVIPLAFVVLVIPYPTAVPSFSYIEGELNTHSTTKVVRYPAIVKRTIVVQDGIQHEEENLAFDAYTGKPVAVRSTDEFKGAYLAQSIPASWEYPEMGGKWRSEGKIIGGSFTYTSDIIDIGNDPCILAEFTRGDVIQLGDNPKSIYHVIGKDYLNNDLRVERATGSDTPPASIAKIKIIHTGRTNQFQQQAGAIAMHHEDKQSLKVPQFDQANRYEANDGGTTKSFTADLENFIKSGQEQNTLTGPYDHLDMSGFADRLTSCTVDLTDVTVAELTFLKTNDGQNVKVQLMKFTVMCGNEPLTVKAEGWE